MFRVNEVLRCEGKVYRVLQVLPDQLVWINIDDSKATPGVILIRDLIVGFDDESFIRIDDPFTELAYVWSENKV